MTKTEKAMLSVKAACSYGPTGRKHTLKLQGSDGMGASDCIDVTIPANVDLLIDIFLVDFQKVCILQNFTNTDRKSLAGSSSDF